MVHLIFGSSMVVSDHPFAMVVFELGGGGIGMVRHPDVAQSKEHIKGFHLAQIGGT